MDWMRGLWIEFWKRGLKECGIDRGSVGVNVRKECSALLIDLPSRWPIQYNSWLAVHCLAFWYAQGADGGGFTEMTQGEQAPPPR